MGALTTEYSRRTNEAEIERARCAWLIASDLSAKAVGADMRKVVQTRGTPGRGSDEITTKARRLACYLATVVANVTHARLATAAVMDRSTIFAHCRWIEDEREKPDFDRLVDGLERTMIGMALAIVMARLGDVAPQIGDAA